MRGLWVLVVVLVGGLATVSQAKDLILAWKFQADYVPAPESFLVTQFSSTDVNNPVQFRVPNEGAASCAGVTDLPDRDANSLCGRPPQCLPPGMYSFWIQAEFPEGPTPASPVANCEALEHCDYTCERVSLPPQLRAMADRLSGANGEPPSDDELQQLLQELAAGPETPPAAGDTTPAPTPESLNNPVQEALDALPKVPV